MTTNQSHCEIQISRGLVTIVDPDVYEEYAKHWKWFAYFSKNAKSYYAYGYKLRHSNVGGDYQFLHRLILGLRKGDGLVADHINGNTLDNRRINLRIATTCQNLWNSSKSSRNISGFKGVSFDKRRGLWYGRISVRRIRHVTPRMKSPEEVHLALQALRKIHHGDFARSE